MCGIAGWVGRGPVDAGVLDAMGRALSHRGPDGGASACFAPFPFEGDVFAGGFAHRRLAVFDPSQAGAQPMRSRSGRFTIVFNGEIYNHHELRRRLPGFPWRTGTDTEVLVELLEREGLAVLAELNGMFAFAAWDDEEKRLWLARDRLGIKPLYLREDKDGVAFASELRGLLAGPRFARRLDLDALSSYLDFGFVPAPRTALEGVEKLSPGCLLEWRPGRSRRVRWWRLPAGRDGAPDAGWREELTLRMLDAVRIQLRSDVPLGCFLSGGIDSSLIAALAKRERGDLTTFSLAFPDAPGFDESLRARRTAARLGTRHVEIPLSSSQAGAEVPSLLQELDEPFADSSLVPVHALARGARDHVTVALAGDGADELFAGYRRYRADVWLRRWHRLPLAARERGLAPWLRSLSPDRSTRLGEWVRRARRVLEVDGIGEADRLFAMTRLIGDGQKTSLVPALEGRGDSARQRFDEHHALAGGRDALDTQLRVDLGFGLPDDMLTKVDRASMAFGLEVRVPFLDHRLVEHVARLPSGLKLRGTRSKAALLDVFGGWLSREVRRAPKHGFEAPLSMWLRGPLRELTHDTLAERRLQDQGVFDVGSVSRMLDDHDRGVTDHGWRLWSLVVWSDWTRRMGVD
ncbi:MAG: asparagine synthase (glutamine-hydrolyzing) [Myxococcota bacterium]